MMPEPHTPPSPARRSGGRQRRAFTLAESMIASTVLAASVIGIVMPLSASNTQAAAASQACAAAALARQLLEEIAAQPFAEPDGTTRLGPSAGKTARSQYDCVGDYHGYGDSTSALAAIDGTGINFGAGPSFARAVAVAYLTGRAGPAAATGDYALVTVTVTAPSGPAVKLSRLLARGRVTW